MEEIVKLLLWPHGINVFPKADGRVEIPQPIVRCVGWDKAKSINIASSYGEVLVSQKRLEGFEEYKISGGRIRIPAGVVKNAGLFQKPVCVIIADKIVIRATIQNTTEISKFLNGLTYEQIGQLKNILTGENIKPAEPSPEMILLDLENPTIFRIIGKPYKIGPDCFLIPGIQMLRGGNKIGFLSVGEKLFDVISAKVRGKELPELIFYRDVFSYGGFKVFVNPPSALPDDMIKKAQEICAQPEKMFDKELNKQGED